MRVGLDSKSKPTAESSNAALAVGENTSNFESTKIVKFFNTRSGLALAHQKLQ